MPYLSKRYSDAAAASYSAAALAICEYFPAFNLAFLKLNSNVRSFWHLLHIARGAVGNRQLATAERVMAWHADAQPVTPSSVFGFEEARRVGVVHHHVTYLPNVRYDGGMLMLDAGDVWQKLASDDFDLLLHGHRHQAAHAAVAYWDDMNRERRLTVIGAGSATARDKGEGNSYYAIRMNHFNFAVNKRTLHQGRFRIDSTQTKTFRIPFAPAGLSSELDLQALQSMMQPDEIHHDRTHHYDHISLYAFVDADRNYWGRYTFFGRNSTYYLSTILPFSVVAVGAHPFADLRVRATDLLTGKHLVVEKPTNRPIMRFPADIHFARPLGHGDTFAVEVSFVLPRVMHEEQDFDAFAFAPYERGVKRLTYHFLSDAVVVEPRFTLLGRRVAADFTSDPAVAYELAFRDETKASLRGKGPRIDVSDPQALGMLFAYRRLQRDST